MPEQQNSLCEIRDFTKFLEECLGRKIFEYSLKNLTKPGDNYGSVMQSVDVKVPGINGCRKVNVELMYILWFIMKLKEKTITEQYPTLGHQNRGYKCIPHRYLSTILDLCEGGSLLFGYHSGYWVFWRNCRCTREWEDWHVYSMFWLEDLLRIKLILSILLPINWIL